MGSRHPAALFLLGAALVALAADPCGAEERELEKETAPTTTEAIKTPLERTFLPPERRDSLFPGLRRQLQGLPAFLADTQLEARFRTYYLRKDRTTDLLSEAWAIGGSVYYHSGWLEDAFAVEVEGFTSQPLVAPDDRGGTGLLAPVQEGYGVLGIANVKLRHKGIVLTGGRQYLGLPFVNRDDSRMTPNTFEALTLAREEGRLRFSTGYIWRIKRRSSDEFVSMAEAALADADRGFGYASVIFRPSEDAHVGVSAGMVPDVAGGIYTETAYTFSLGKDVSVRLDGQFEYQRSVGDELLPTGPFETWNLGVRTSTGWKGALFRLGFSLNGEDSPIISPFGSNPSYVSLMQRTFNQAGEKALLLSLSYDFANVGVDGLSAILNFVQGWDGRVLGVRGSAREVDFTVDYRLSERSDRWKGLWLRLRASWLDEEVFDRDGTDFRVILRYDLPVL